MSQLPTNVLRVVYAAEPLSYDKIAQRIRLRRLEWGMTQTELARRLDVSTTTISSWEAGAKNPHPDMQKRLTNWLDEEPPQRATLDFDLDELPQRLRNRRHQFSMTQTELARRLGVYPTTISHWETDTQNPHPDMQKRLAVWFAEELPEAAGCQKIEHSILIQNMQEKRKRLGIGTSKLEQLMGVTQGQVSRWEAGRSAPNASSREKISRWLHDHHDQLQLFPPAA